jgi:hypothetical protein
MMPIGGQRWTPRVTMVCKFSYAIHMEPPDALMSPVSSWETNSGGKAASAMASYMANQP